MRTNLSQLGRAAYQPINRALSRPATVTAEIRICDDSANQLLDTGIEASFNTIDHAGRTDWARTRVDDKRVLRWPKRFKGMRAWPISVKARYPYRNATGNILSKLLYKTQLSVPMTTTCIRPAFRLWQANSSFNLASVNEIAAYRYRQLMVGPKKSFTVCQGALVE